MHRIRSKMITAVEIDLPIDKVVELFMDKENFKEWKKDFVRYEHISGTPDEVGAVTKLVYKRLTMFETITSKRLPAEIVEEYEHKRGKATIMFHKAINRFTSIEQSKTLYELDSEVTKVVGLLPTLIMKLMASAGRRYAQDQLEQFKALAEQQNHSR
jgi:hypothetical protein